MEVSPVKGVHPIPPVLLIVARILCEKGTGIRQPAVHSSPTSLPMPAAALLCSMQLLEERIVCMLWMVPHPADHSETPAVTVQSRARLLVQRVREEKPTSECLAATMRRSLASTPPLLELPDAIGDRA